ncbi:methylated-DNA--[protein]-cysteine S-methyltransferase [Desemzia sp. FAM 23989]|uniref:methylated-DNA--[protein]-cysteine S-methyltransferase n=1 Tax=Desemzia sp. FAM 23989 TaxID=3259523 RepID=UPI0038867A2B
MEENTQKMYYCAFVFDDNEYLIAATTKGLAFVGSKNAGLIELVVWIEMYRAGTLLEENNKFMQEYQMLLEEYFQGTRKEFDVPLDIKGTNFQETVWRELLNTPYGETRTYSDIADAVGNPKAIRAVSGAIGKNPVAIVVPCHRVIGKNGKLTGYRGGLEMKKELLELEKCTVPQLNIPS